jgi:hypothetical protein
VKYITKDIPVYEGGPPVFDWSQPQNKWRTFEPLAKYQPFKHAPYPSCPIPQEHCEEQWQAFRGAFGNWTMHYVGERFSEDYTGPVTIHEDEMVNIDQWIYFQDYIKRDGFFGNCPQIEGNCLKNHPITGDGAGDEPKFLMHGKEGADVMHKCQIVADQFVVMHWPLNLTNTTRDLCSNTTEEYEREIARNRAVGGPEVRATLDYITFTSSDREMGGEL